MKNYREAEVTIKGMVKNQAWTKKIIPQETGPKMYSGLFNKIEK